MELTGVAGLVLCAHRQQGQLRVVQGSTQAHSTSEGVFDTEVAFLAVGGHSGGVTLLRGLPPQHLLHSHWEAVPAGECGRIPTNGRLVTH